MGLGRTDRIVGPCPGPRDVLNAGDITVQPQMGIIPQHTTEQTSHEYRYHPILLYENRYSISRFGRRTGRRKWPSLRDINMMKKLDKAANRFANLRTTP